MTPATDRRVAEQDIRRIKTRKAILCRVLRWQGEFVIPSVAIIGGF